MRALKSTFAIVLVVAVLFGAVALTYFVGGLVERYGFHGAARLTNILFLMLVFVMTTGALLTIADRKWGAMVQDRVGPNRARFGLPGLRNAPLGGIPHLVADAVKMLTKEAFVPGRANRLLFNLGPALTFASVFALFAIVPAGPTIQEVFGGQSTSIDMVVATPDFGLLFVLAIASLAVYGTALAGWSSNNKLALLGGVRASSQMISYEVALGLSLVGLMLAFSAAGAGSSIQLPALGDAQSHYVWRTGAGFDFGLPAWGIFLQPIGFLGFFAAAFAETKRPPFDLPEGDSEIVGYFVEYSGMGFGLFMISEYVEVVILSGITAALFFGGYHLPFGDEAFRGWGEQHQFLWGTILGTWFWVKVLLLCWIQLTIRWTYPRFRYDQIQSLGWKILLPLGLLNVFVSGALVLVDPSLQALTVVGLLEIAVVIALTVRQGAPEHGGHDLEQPLGHSAAAAAHAPGHGTAGTAEAAPAPLPH